MRIASRERCRRRGLRSDLSWTMGSGMWASAVPSVAMMISRTTMAVAVPVNADRQPRTLPTARTTVRSELDDGQRNVGERCSECGDDDQQNDDGCGSAC